MIFLLLETKLSKNYLGCEIEKLGNGNIYLNQNEYIKSIPDVTVPMKINSCKANEAERKKSEVSLESCYGVRFEH